MITTFINLKNSIMKRKFTSLFFGMAMLFCIQGQSQSISPFALNSMGGSFENATSYTRLEWNFGELTLTDTYTGANAVTLTNGLLQPCTNEVEKSFIHYYFGINEWKIFPNVTQGLFELDFFINLPGNLTLQLTNALGQVINKREIIYHCCNRIEQYDLSNQPNGTYFINAVFTPNLGFEQLPHTIVRRKGTFKVMKVK